MIWDHDIDYDNNRDDFCDIDFDDDGNLFKTWEIKTPEVLVSTYIFNSFYVYSVSFRDIFKVWKIPHKGRV